MAQKTHPVGFRIGATKPHNTTWFARNNFYVQQLRRDHTIRHIWESLTATEQHGSRFDLTAQITKLNIQHKPHLIQLTVYTGSPEVLLRDDKKFFRKLLERLKSRDCSVNYRLRLVKDRTAAISSVLVAKGLAYKIQHRTHYKYAMQQVKKMLETAKVPGFRIQVSGRLGGVEIARKAWISSGRVPLQTLAADIDYSLQEAKTRYGIIGIKVWIFTGKFFNKL